ncbi:MAG: hypothetical protein ACOWWR_05090 [Eubacteriales bacterium]
MKKLLSITLMICLLATTFTTIANAKTTDTSHEEPSNLSFAYEELKEMFPQSNIKKYQEPSIFLKDNGTPNSLQQIEYDADDPMKTPIKVYSINNGKFTQYLAEYEDGSYVTYGILSGNTGIRGDGSYQSGYYIYFNGIVFWENYAGYANMRYKVTYRVNDVTGAVYITNASYGSSSHIIPKSLTRTSTTATMKGDVVLFDEPLPYIRLVLKLTVRAGGGTTVTPTTEGVY